MFILDDIVWVDANGNETPQAEVSRTMIDVADIKLVQFLSATTGSHPNAAAAENSPIPLALIAERAYSIWEREKDRRDEQDWLQAEKELNKGSTA